MTLPGETNSHWRWSLVINGLIVAVADFKGEIIAPLKPIYLRLEPQEGRLAKSDHIVLKVEEVE